MHENSNKSMLSLIAGPYHSGTNDDPASTQTVDQETGLALIELAA